LKKAILYLIHALLALIMLVGFFLGILGGAWGSLTIAVVIAFYFAIKWQKGHREKEVSAS
jgi:4-hydroxybenzoate polyprenyltransferase